MKSLIERGGVADLVDTAYLQVILQIATHAFQGVQCVDAMLLKQVARADPRKLQ